MSMMQEMVAMRNAMMQRQANRARGGRGGVGGRGGRGRGRRGRRPPPVPGRRGRGTRRRGRGRRGRARRGRGRGRGRGRRRRGRGRPAPRTTIIRPRQRSVAELVNVFEPIEHERMTPYNPDEEGMHILDIPNDVLVYVIFWYIHPYKIVNELIYVCKDFYYLASASLRNRNWGDPETDPMGVKTVERLLRFWRPRVPIMLRFIDLRTFHQNTYPFLLDVYSRVVHKKKQNVEVIYRIFREMKALNREIHKKALIKVYRLAIYKLKTEEWTQTTYELLKLILDDDNMDLTFRVSNHLWDIESFWKTTPVHIALRYLKDEDLPLVKKVHQRLENVKRFNKRLPTQHVFQCLSPEKIRYLMSFDEDSLIDLNDPEFYVELCKHQPIELIRDVIHHPKSNIDSLSLFEVLKDPKKIGIAKMLLTDEYPRREIVLGARNFSESLIHCCRTKGNLEILKLLYPMVVEREDRMFSAPAPPDAGNVIDMGGPPPPPPVGWTGPGPVGGMGMFDDLPPPPPPPPPGEIVDDENDENDENEEEDEGESDDEEIQEEEEEEEGEEVGELLPPPPPPPLQLSNEEENGNEESEANEEEEEVSFSFAPPPPPPPPPTEPLKFELTSTPVTTNGSTSKENDDDDILKSIRDRTEKIMNDQMKKKKEEEEEEEDYGDLTEEEIEEKMRLKWESTKTKYLSQRYTIAFLHACQAGDIPMVNYLIGKGREDGRVDPSGKILSFVHTVDEAGFTFFSARFRSKSPLIVSDDLEIVRLLLGMEEVDPSHDGSGCFRYACQRGNLEVVNMLYEDGRVDPSAKNNSAFKFAVARRREDMCVWLIKTSFHDKRIDPSVQGSEILTHLVDWNRVDLLRELLEKDDRMDVTTGNNMCVQKALKVGDLALVKIILSSKTFEDRHKNLIGFMISASRKKTGDYRKCVRCLLDDGRVAINERDRITLDRWLMQ